ncbi:MAG: hypothetical protein IT453_21270 [Planctomycetes bacterium]|nr:hypothetical protein [Planctomycetota bacterium]
MSSSPSLSVWSIALLLASCASDRPPRVLALDHPANPDAAIPERTAFVDPFGSTPVDEAPAAQPSSEFEYVCPMHADVVRSQPGECPKCGMELKPRERHAHEEPR